MPFIERLKSFLEAQLEGWAPDELVSMGAELGVAACVVAPFIALGALGRWMARKKDLCQQATTATRHPGAHGGSLNAIKHRS